MNKTKQTEDQILYELASNRVKKLKGFYSHLAIYLIANSAILVGKYVGLHDGESLFQLQFFSTAIFWGIGLLGHAASVFGPNLFLSKDWENKKIKELLEKENKSNLNL